MGALIHWFIVSLNRFFGSLVQWITGSLFHWIIDSLIHSFIGSLAHWLVGSLVHWAIDLLDLLLHWFMIRWLIVSLVHRVIGTFTQLCTDSSMSILWHLNHQLLFRWCTSQPQLLMAFASQKRSSRPLISYSHLLCSKLSSRRVPGTIWQTLFKHTIPTIPQFVYVSCLGFQA
jgi:hypothetical protein